MRRCTALLVTMMLLPAAVGAVEVARVEVIGNRYVSTQKILSIFGVAAGEEFKAGKVSQGVRRLFQSKDFADVAAEYLDEAGKAVILLRVEEYPRVRAVRITGNAETTLTVEGVWSGVQANEPYQILSVKRRYVALIDRSNVRSVRDRPEVLMFAEVR